MTTKKWPLYFVLNTQSKGRGSRTSQEQEVSAYLFQTNALRSALTLWTQEDILALVYVSAFIGILYTDYAWSEQQSP
ncbi:unnamed protein product [Fusarium graminearum]|uniref:Chromosome 1, complete genome n=1 Tax=Gibberella zeae (strain ATCC MYA-4620 / CBS 123657 / FGSC 9075 / NRRL 31084 / PH-1) TaxID=229533 RepID=A0A098DCY8_GIBZE|nr:unnamed protein product [Fusarium graminearum]CZS79101.1 unnamed protein product [Fusarium graminearum]